MILEKPFFDQLQGPGVREAVWVELDGKNPKAVPSYGSMIFGNFFFEQNMLWSVFFGEKPG